MSILVSLSNKIQDKKDYNKSNDFLQKKIFDLKNILLYGDTIHFTHQECIDNLFIVKDVIVDKQISLLKKLIQTLPDNILNSDSVVLSKGGLLKPFWIIEGIEGFVNTELPIEARKIILNGNDDGFIFMHYTHEFMHYFVGNVYNNNKIVQLYEDIKKDFDREKYIDVYKNSITKYPKYKDYFRSTDEYGFKNANEMFAEAYSNPFFREYLKTQKVDGGKNFLEQLSHILNEKYNQQLFD